MQQRKFSYLNSFDIQDKGANLWQFENKWTIFIGAIEFFENREVVTGSKKKLITFVATFKRQRLRFYWEQKYFGRNKKLFSVRRLVYCWKNTRTCVEPISKCLFSLRVHIKYILILWKGRVVQSKSSNFTQDWIVKPYLLKTCNYLCYPLRRVLSFASCVSQKTSKIAVSFSRIYKT